MNTCVQTHVHTQNTQILTYNWSRVKDISLRKYTIVMLLDYIEFNCNELLNRNDNIWIIFIMILRLKWAAFLEKEEFYCSTKSWIMFWISSMKWLSDQCGSSIATFTKWDSSSCKWGRVCKRVVTRTNFEKKILQNCLLSTLCTFYKC